MLGILRMLRERMQRAEKVCYSIANKASAEETMQLMQEWAALFKIHEAQPKA